MFNTTKLKQLIRNSYYLTETKFYRTQISQEDIERVQKSWKEAEKSATSLGKAFFEGLFKNSPEYAKLFSKWGECPEDLVANEEFISEHAIKNVIVSFGNCIKKIDDPCEAYEMAEKIGRKHLKYCITPSHFKTAKPVFLNSLKTVMGNKIDCKTVAAWETAAKIIFGGLMKGVE